MNSALIEYKSRFFQNEKLTHLNNAGLAPISMEARLAIQYWAKRFYEEGFYTDHDYMNAVAQTRHSLAKLIGCESNELAFFTSTSGGINQIAFALDLKHGDEVLMWDQEYSSHLYPWKQACLAKQATLVLIESESNLQTPTEKFLSAITEKTKVVAFSWMQFQSGAMMDAEQVIKHCKQKNIFVFVDIMQGLGLFPCELWHWGADAVAGGSHKWLTSPVGAGYLAVRKNLISKIQPRNFGAMTFGTCDDPSDFACVPKLDATKFEPGSKQVLEITAMGASCELILKTGVQAIENESLRLAQNLADGLTELGCQVFNPNKTSENQKLTTPLVNWTPPAKLAKTIDQTLEHLTRHHINWAKRGPGIRFSTHAFNQDADIQKVLHVLADFFKS